MKLLIPVSPGELLDKLTILDLKSERISVPEQLVHVRHERRLLSDCWASSGLDHPDLAGLLSELRQVNESLWQIEDEVRGCEARADFGARFIDLARAVYLSNDRRAAVKKRINELLGSEIVEEKSYDRSRSIKQ